MMIAIVTSKIDLVRLVLDGGAGVIVASDGRFIHKGMFHRTLKTLLYEIRCSRGTK